MHSREEAAKILDPYMPLLAEPFPVAWDRWEALGRDFPEVQTQLTPRARANVIYDTAASRARTIFSGLAPKVTVQDTHGFLLLVFEGELHVRLKKFRNGSLAVSGIPTQQQLDFATQQPLPGMPRATNLILGYQLDALQTAIGRIAVTCSTGSARHWTLDVPMAGGAVAQLPRPQGVTPPSIRSKRDEEDERRTEGS